MLSTHSPQIFSFSRNTMWQFNFLGVANGGQLGTSSAVLLYQSEPQLLIDCGPNTLLRYMETHDALPPAVYISHLHIDHIGDLEALFYKACFLKQENKIKIFVSAHLVAQLTLRIGNYPGQLAEGGVNFWDTLQLVPVIEGFWWRNHYYKTYPTRHHQPNSAHALHLPGVFFYTGDTRPIPELLHHYCCHGETIFHDCGLESNPSHSSAEELLKEYQPNILSRLIAYHYHNENQAEQIRLLGIEVASPGSNIELPRNIRTSQRNNTPLKVIG